MLNLKVAPTFAASGSGLAEKDKEERASATAWIRSRLATHLSTMAQERLPAIPETQKPSLDLRRRLKDARLHASRNVPRTSGRFDEELPRGKSNGEQLGGQECLAALEEFF